MIFVNLMRIHDINFETRPKVLDGDVLSYNYTGITFSPYANY